MDSWLYWNINAFLLNQVMFALSTCHIAYYFVFFKIHIDIYYFRFHMKLITSVKQDLHLKWNSCFLVNCSCILWNILCKSILSTISTCKYIPCINQSLTVLQTKNEIQYIEVLYRLWIVNKRVKPHPFVYTELLSKIF